MIKKQPVYLDYFDPSTVHRDSKIRSLRHLNILKTFGYIDNMGSLRIRRACTFRELKEAYALSYQVFLAKKYIAPNFIGMRLREWEQNDETVTFIAQDHKRTVGIISLAPEIPHSGLPADDLYNDEIMTLRTRGGKLAEACNIAVLDTYRNVSLAIEFFRCILTYAWFADIAYFIAVANKNHKTSYEFLYMNQIGPEKSYSEDHYDPVVLMCMDCNKVREYLCSAESDNESADSYLRDYLYHHNPYFTSMQRWERRARKFFISESIKARFQDEIRNSLIETVLVEMHRPGLTP